MIDDSHAMRISKSRISQKYGRGIREIAKFPQVAVILLVLIFSVFAAPVSANDELHSDDASGFIYTDDYNYGYLDIPGFSVANTYHENESNQSPYPPQGTTPLPESYDLRDFGFVTPVKNQNPYGTCWAFSVINSIESNTVKKGYENLSTADFSELQLIYFLYNRNNVTAGIPLPKLSGLKGDDVRIPNTDDNYLNIGGNSVFAALHLATGMGAVRESDVPYQWAGHNLSLEYAVDNNVYTVSNAYIISPSNARDEVKKYLTECGCGVIMYNSTDKYYNYDAEYKGVISPSYYQDVDTSINHLVSLVGWDDNYPKENFKVTPPNNGAWLIKNSWGTNWGDEGYFWLSYDDVSLKDVVFFDVRKSDSYDNIYQYDGSLSTSYIYWVRAQSGYINSPKAVNRFTAKDNEIITDVSFVTYNRDVSYKVEILKNDNEVVSSQNGTLEHCGYHTVHLLQPVNVDEGEEFAVAVSFTAKDDTLTIYGDPGLAVPIDRTYGYNWVEMVSASLPGQGYFIYDNGNIDDVHDKQNANLRIKAFTTNLPKISAASLSLSSDIAVRFYVNDSSLTGYRDAYMNVMFNGTEYTLQPTQDQSEPRQMFVFKHIAPYEMNETISVTLFATKEGDDSPAFCDELDYSIKDYCVNQMDKAGVKNSLTTLCVDLLNYGSSSQVYCGETDAKKLVNSTLSEGRKGWASSTVVPETRNDKFVSEEGNDSVGVWRAASLNLYSDISLVFKFTSDENPENLTAEITYGKDGESKAVINKFANSTYGNGLPCKSFKFDKLNALELNRPVTVVLKNNDGEVSKVLVYSVDAYAYSKASEGGNLGNLVDSIMKYIRSVNNLFAGE